MGKLRDVGGGSGWWVHGARGWQTRVSAEPPRLLIHQYYFYTEIETKILNTDYDQKILIVCRPLQ